VTGRERKQLQSLKTTRGAFILTQLLANNMTAPLVDTNCKCEVQWRQFYIHFF